MDVTGIRQRITEFDQRNGGNAVEWNGWWIYHNGAMREEDPLGALIDPPKDEYERLRRVVQWHQAHLARAVRQFENFQAELLMAPDPKPAALDELKRLQAAVSEKSAAVEQAKQAVANTPQGKAIAENRRYWQEQKEKQAAFRTSVKEIRI